MTPMTEAFANAARSVAKMVLTEDGATYICSGTLLNDTDPSSQVPYFCTAAQHLSAVFRETEGRGPSGIMVSLSRRGARVVDRDRLEIC